MKKYLPLTITLLLILFVTTKKTNAVTIDFESFLDGDVVTSQFPGITFSNATAITAGITLNEFEFPPHSGSNVVFDDGGPMTIEFSTLMSDVGAYLTYAASLTLNFFDISNTLVGTVNSAFSSNLGLSGDPGSSSNELLSFTWASGISKVTITGDPLGGSFVMDDLTLTPYTPSGDPIPEPSSLLLLASGFVGMVGYGWRRARR